MGALTFSDRSLTPVLLEPNQLVGVSDPRKLEPAAGVATGAAAGLAAGGVSAEHALTRASEEARTSRKVPEPKIVIVRRTSYCLRTNPRGLPLLLFVALHVKGPLQPNHCTLDERQKGETEQGRERQPQGHMHPDFWGSRLFEP